MTNSEKILKKIKICLVATWQTNYKTRTKRGGRESDLSFPTLINLAALTPDDDVSVQYEHIRPIDYDVDADLVGISFISPFADHTFKVIADFKNKRKTVVLGGPYVTVFPEKCKGLADAIVIGEAEYSWPALVEDFKKGELKKEYHEKDYQPENGSNELKLPIPRFDLITKDVFFSQNIIATRGCPHSCDFCFLKCFTKGFRTRPINDVIRDINAHKGRNWLQNKVLGFWDDNLIGNIQYAKDLFKQLKPLKKWWVAQVTISFAYDEELLKLAADSGCVAVYIGFESFNQDSLKEVHKSGNRVKEYREVVKRIHKYGIAVASGLIVGFDHDTIDVFDQSVKAMHQIGIDWVNANILVPFQGTRLYKQLQEEGRILTDHSYFYNGSGVAFQPKLMTSQQLNDGFLRMVKEIYSVKNTFRRIWRFFRDVGIRKMGAWVVFLMSNIVYLFMKRLERVMAEDGQPVIEVSEDQTQKKKIKPRLKSPVWNLEKRFYSFIRGGRHSSRKASTRKDQV